MSIMDEIIEIRNSLKETVLLSEDDIFSPVSDKERISRQKDYRQIRREFRSIVPDQFIKRVQRYRVCSVCNRTLVKDEPLVDVKTYRDSSARICSYCMNSLNNKLQELVKEKQ
jgi:hypothetical protein